MSNKIITPEYRNVILNILLSLSTKALIDSIKESIIRVNKNRERKQNIPRKVTLYV